MNIVFIVAVFPPEGEPSAVMAAELARGWVQAGHEVTVVCPFPSRPQGVIHSGFRRRLFVRAAHDGTRVVRVWTWMIGRHRVHINRILENVSFGISSGLALLFLKKPQIVVLESWPILAQLPVLLICGLRRITLLNYVKDLYPEALTAAGLITKNGFLDRLLLRLDSFICRHCTCNILISESARDHVARTRKLPGSKVCVIHDWLDLELIRPFSAPSRWRDEVAISNQDLLFMYAGTMGYASKVNVLTRVAQKLAGIDDIHIVCIGEGVLKEEMQREKAVCDLHNLTLLPFQPRARISEVQSCADVMLMLTSRQMGVSSVPSKFITYLAVGKPILCAADENSDLARLVQENEIGLVVEPENVAAIADGMARMCSFGRHMLCDMALRARELAVRRYSMQRALSDFTHLFSVQYSIHALEQVE